MRPDVGPFRVNGEAGRVFGSLRRWDESQASSPCPSSSPQAVLPATALAHRPASWLPASACEFRSSDPCLSRSRLSLGGGGAWEQAPGSSL